MKSLISIAALVSLATATLGVSSAQDISWRRYAPADKSFSIELPSSLIRVASFDGEHGANFDPGQSEQGASSYSAKSASEESRFGIVVINGRSKFLGSLKRAKALEGLGWLLIADEDELQFMRPATSIKHGGLVGKEYLYIKENTIQYPLFTRGRIFDTGKRIFVLVFIGRDAKDLHSSDAERFFGSFRLPRK